MLPISKGNDVESKSCSSRAFESRIDTKIKI